MSVDHYMVDYTDKSDVVRFANDTPLHSLKDAKALARRQSKAQPCTAAVVAYSANGDGTFTPVGHVMFYDGRVSDVDGQVA